MRHMYHICSCQDSGIIVKEEVKILYETEVLHDYNEMVFFKYRGHWCITHTNSDGTHKTNIISSQTNPYMEMEGEHKVQTLVVEMFTAVATGRKRVFSLNVNPGKGIICQSVEGHQCKDS